jgi:fructuronate reductase
MRLRLRHGAHSGVACSGAPPGLHRLRDALANPPCVTSIRGQVARVARRLDRRPGFRVEGEIAALILRCANPAIHRCLQIAMDGSRALPQRRVAPALIRIARAAL